MSSAEINRRGFVAGAAAVGGTALFVPNSFALNLHSSAYTPTLKGTGFPDGVASGDPTPTAITLWTRVGGATATSGKVLVEVATDSGFSRVVKRALVTSTKAKLHTTKTRVTGLSAHTQYYYRFKIKTSSGTKSSRVGKFRTALPADSTQTVNFAYFTCQDYTAGYFNAHALLANEDIDFVVNLGDFIYETAFTSAGTLEKPGAMIRPGNFPASQFLSGPVSYSDYCGRYQRYRSDTDLQAMAANHAMISTWDDHEVMNDYVGGVGANGGNASRSVPNANPAFSYEGWSDARKVNAYKAWFDNMPTFPVVSGGYQLYHKASFGKNLDLWVLDERQYRAAQPCGFKASGIDPATCTELNNPRDFLGPAQLNYLKGGLASSGAKWKVLANEVVAMEVRNSTGNIDSTDDWTAYPVERQSLLGAIKAGNVKNVVFTTGDYHTFMAGTVKDSSGTTVATEFASGSVTQLSNPEIAAMLGYAGFGTLGNVTLPDGYKESDFLAASPDLLEYDQLHHGYVLASASSSQFSATFKKLATTRSKSTALAASKTYTVAANSTTITS